MIRGSGTCDCVVTHASTSCILFVQKLGASGVAVGEVCSFDGVASSENEACSSIIVSDFLHRLNYNTQEVTSCFAASSVRYLRMELMRFNS